MRSWIRLLVILSATGLSGCANVNPYRPYSLAMTPKLPALAAAPSDESGDLDGHNRPPQQALVITPKTVLAGDLHEAIDRAEALRQAYYLDLRGVASTRSLGSLGVTAAAALAAATGLRPGATEGDTTRALRLGVASSTGYLISDYLSNRKHENAYAAGYRKLTCLISQSAPLQWPTGDPGTPTPTPSTSTVGCAKADFLGPGHLTTPSCIRLRACNSDQDQYRCASVRALETTAALRSALEDLNLVVNLEHSTLSAALASLAGKPALGERVKRSQRDALRQREAALRLARSTLKEGHVMLNLIEGSGPLLNGRAGLVSAWVNQKVADGQNDVLRPSLAPTAPADLLPTLKTVGMEAEAESKLAESPVGMKQLQKAGSAGTEGSGSAPLTADSSASNAATRRTSTVDDLDALEKRIIALVVDPEARRRELKKLRDRQAHGEAYRKLKLERDALAKQLYLARKAGPDPGECSAPSSPCNLERWAIGTDRLHQFRRPVAQALISFREEAKTVAHPEICGGDRAQVVIAPDADQVVYPPSEAEFVISTESGATPKVSLSGNAGVAAPDKPLTVTILDGVVTAKVKVGAAAPAGQLTLTATDHSGRGSQSVLLIVRPRDGNDPESLPDFLR